MTNHNGYDNSGNPKANYLARIAGMNETQLAEETALKIWLSAFASNNPRSDYHWHCDACYDECQRRGRGDIYTTAHAKASA